jgi:hypothetical protein
MYKNGSWEDFDRAVTAAIAAAISDKAGREWARDHVSELPSGRFSIPAHYDDIPDSVSDALGTPEPMGYMSEYRRWILERAE